VTFRSKALLLLCWLALVAPQTFLGYGSDGDSWLVAGAAERIWTTGRYVASRSSGFPLFEILAAPLVHAGGWYLANMLALTSGLLFLLALFRLADRGEMRHPVLVKLSLGFLPVVTTNSSSTMDYIPAMALLLWAYVLLLEERTRQSAILVGIACGFRPTSGLFILPCAVYLWKARRSVWPVVSTVLLATVVGLAAYSPVLLTYGIRHVYPEPPVDLRTRILVGGYSALELLGLVPWMAVAVSLALSLRRRSTAGLASVSPWLAFHVSNIVVWTALFLGMPFESAYLMPLLPSVMLLIDRWAERTTVAVVCALLLCYHVVCVDVLGGESGSRSLHLSLRPGMTIADIQDRRFKLSTRRAATAYTAQRPTVLMFGNPWIVARNDAWIWDESLGMFRQSHGLLFVSDRILDESRLEELKRRDFRLVVWKGEKWEYLRACDFDWQHYVEVIDDLPGFFGTPIDGRTLMAR